MVKITFIPVEEFRRIREAPIDKYTKLALIADMCRANTLAAVKQAGSGHLGSSLSATDIVVWLYYAEMNTLSVGLDHPDRDIYFSSKGHDVPGLYAVLFSLGIIPQEKFLKLRRLGGLDGHPSLGIPGLEASSGSLGMGISKARGMAWAKRKLGRGGRVFVMTGDGELQEGQNYEALQAAIQQRVTNLTVIVDHNKVQSDKLISQVIDLGDLERKFQAFGWHVARCDGHDLRQIEQTLADFKSVVDKPKVLIADTIKGRGVSFMEHPAALHAGHGLYPWHAGAPNDEAFEAGYRELVERINARLSEADLVPLALEEVPSADKPVATTRGTYSLVGEPVSQAAQATTPTVASDEYVSKSFGQALVEIAAQRPDLVVLDADLAADCKIRDFEMSFPDRFIENGIAEQDMVSMAGGLARLGLLPVVNSFANFLVARANEQIYNNACDNNKIIYVCHYAGLIPAGPGKSHQSIRDISLLGALPNCVIVEPCNAVETRMTVEYCVNQAEETCVLRLVIGPSPRIIPLPKNYKLTPGRGVTLTEGADAALFAYGPVMLHEALIAAEILRGSRFQLKVVNMPWLNRVDRKWLEQVLDTSRALYVLEDHAPVGGLGDILLNGLAMCGLTAGLHFAKFAVQGYPVWGNPVEVLRHHRLDGASLAERILRESD